MKKYNIYERKPGEMRGVLIATMYHRITAEEFCLLCAARYKAQGFENYGIYYTTDTGKYYNVSDVLEMWGIKDLNAFISEEMKIDFRRV